MRSDRMDARRDGSPRRFSPATLFVGGLNFATDEATLRDACEAHGEVDSVKIIYDHDTRRSRGFAFVTFEREADARRAAEAMDGRNVDGRRVRCNLADERRRGGDVAGASDRRDFLATRRDEHDRRDESERRKRRRRSVSPSGPSDDENEFEPDENEASPRVAALESLLAKTRREAVAQRARADAAEAALARAVSQRNAEKNEGDSAADSAPSQALRAALRLTLRAMAELEAARPATRRALDALERA
jgi:RNA recognition motif-containing protein